MADFAELLRQRGIQATAQRLAVLRAVAGQPHITADGVADTVRGEIGAISLQSVYDALGLLVAERLIRRIQPAGSPARFEDRSWRQPPSLDLSHLRSRFDVECAVGSAPCITAVDDMGTRLTRPKSGVTGAAVRIALHSRHPPSAPTPRSPPPAEERILRFPGRIPGPTHIT